MRKILLGLGLTFGMHTLLTAGPTITFNFENGDSSTLSVLGGQRISVSDLKHKLWETGVVPEGHTLKLMDEAMAPVSPNQVFKGRVAVDLWVKFVKLSKEDKEPLISSPVSPVKKRNKNDMPSSPCAMR